MMMTKNWRNKLGELLKAVTDAAAGVDYAEYAVHDLLSSNSYGVPGLYKKLDACSGENIYEEMKDLIKDAFEQDNSKRGKSDD